MRHRQDVRGAPDGRLELVDRRTKPLKKTEASRTSSDSCTAWRSESEIDGDEQAEPERREHEQRR